MPGEPYVSCPGLDFANATSSATVRTPSAEVATSRIGVRVNWVMCVKSWSGS
jgi:hypothetical protein